MRSTRFIITAAVGAALVLGLSSRQAMAQTVPDGFQGHASSVFGLHVFEGATDVTAAGPSLTGTHTYSLKLDTGATYAFDNTGSHPLSEVFGFYIVYPTPATNTTDSIRTTTATGWSLDTINGGGSDGVARGYHTHNGANYRDPGDASLYQPNTLDNLNNDTLLHKGSVGNFTFQASTDLNGLTSAYWGFDIFGTDIFPGSTGNTGKIYLAVPEPIFYQLGALLGLGGIGMIRMRRKAASKA